MPKSKDKHKYNKFKYKGLKHGGRILAAAEKYNISIDEWLDLSTGLNPNAWPVKNVPDKIWQSLPEENDGLQTAACQYYACDACLPIAGSQAAIQMLPTLRSRSKVGVISPTYAEHEYNWKHAGHDVIQLSLEEVEHHINTLDVLVVINPNNPTGDIVAVKQLLSWYQRLSSRGGWLVVDEAFIDTTPEKSLIPSGIKPGLIILRSMGKFFGIAGIRCGFIISDDELLQQLAQKLGPWSLTGPTRYIAKQALLDKAWQIKTQKDLKESSIRLNKLLSQAGLTASGETALFQWIEHANANEIFSACAKKGVLLRLYQCENKSISPSLRFGLPATEKQWQRLSELLVEISYLTSTTKKKTTYV